MTTPTFSLDNQIAIITGGASGIGLAIANYFQLHGAKVIIFDKAVLTADQFQDHYQVDVTNRASVDKAVQSVIKAHGKIDILVNSAGIVMLDNAENLSEAAWQKTLDINLTAIYTLCQLVGRHMLENRAGKIINLASQAGIVALEQHLAYCVSKAGVIALTKTLALEWGPSNIQINAISPTVVMTELGKKAWSGDKATEMLKKIPMRRFAEPDEIAGAAVFLASQSANMITGENLVIDGGYTIQ